MSSVQRLALVVFCWASLAYVSSEKSQVNVTTSKGEIIGVRVNPNPATGVSYDAFLGVPYGKVQGRFQVAVQPDSWSQPLITQEDGAMCPQPNEKYSENCLFLNVFTPMNASQNAAASLPVMAFIHGSAFTVSSSSSRLYGPDFLIPEGVILVAMNYRLGAAGFLTLGTKIAPGNLGLTDTLLALQWIQREIHHFGGNRSSVTLMGQSAGSAMTQFHYLSSQSTDLFVRAIAHSGSAASDWSLLTLQEGVRRSMLLAQSVGCDPTMKDVDLLKCLQAVDIKDNQWRFFHLST